MIREGLAEKSDKGLKVRWFWKKREAGSRVIREGESGEANENRATGSRSYGTLGLSLKLLRAFIIAPKFPSKP